MGKYVLDPYKWVSHNLYKLRWFKKLISNILPQTLFYLEEIVLLQFVKVFRDYLWIRPLLFIIPSMLYFYNSYLCMLDIFNLVSMTQLHFHTYHLCLTALRSILVFQYCPSTWPYWFQREIHNAYSHAQIPLRIFLVLRMLPLPFVFLRTLKSL